MALTSTFLSPHPGVSSFATILWCALFLRLDLHCNPMRYDASTGASQWLERLLLACLFVTSLPFATLLVQDTSIQTGSWVQTIVGDYMPLTAVVAAVAVILYKHPPSCCRRRQTQ